MKKFTEYIAEFTTYGKPTHGIRDIKVKQYSEYWPAYKPGMGVSMLIDDPVKADFNLPFHSEERPGRIKFWLDLLGYKDDVLSDYKSSTKDEL